MFFNHGDMVKLKHASGDELREDAHRSNMLFVDMEKLVGRRLSIVRRGYMDTYLVEDTVTGIRWLLWRQCLVPHNGCVFDV